MLFSAIDVKRAGSTASNSYGATPSAMHHHRYSPTPPTLYTPSYPDSYSYAHTQKFPFSSPTSGSPSMLQHVGPFTTHRIWQLSSTGSAFVALYKTSKKRVLYRLLSSS